MGHVQRYQGRIICPLMDRIDIHVDVRRVPFEKLAGLEGGESSGTIRARVERARKVQHFCQPDDAGKNLMHAAVKQMDLSARAYHRVLKLSRTIADQAGYPTNNPAASTTVNKSAMVLAPF